ncbi:hypothetical protein CL628_01100 [bacterium]|nr:hypothetical protein [bacterium]
MSDSDVFHIFPRLYHSDTHQYHLWINPLKLEEFSSVFPLAKAGTHKIESLPLGNGSGIWSEFEDRSEVWGVLEVSVAHA